MRTSSSTGKVLLVAVLLGLMAPLFGASTVSNLVVYYKLEEAAGNSAADSGPGAFTGTWSRVSVGGQTLVAASAAGDCAPVAFNPGNSRSIVFTKPTGAGGGTYVPGGYVNIPTNPAFTFTGPFTAMAWIKPVDFAVNDNPNNTGAIIQKWTWNGSSTIGYGMNRDQAGTISFWMGDAAGDTILTTGAITQAGVWSHVAIVFTGTGRQIWINGTLSAADSYTALGTNTADLHIGVDDWARNYYGNVDEVKLFGRALSQSEISAVMMNSNAVIAAGNTGTVDPRGGLLATYYSFPVGSPTNLPSAGGSGPGSTPTSPMNTPPKQAGTVLLGRCIEQVNHNYQTWYPTPLATNGKDWFMTEWTGFLNVPANDTYTFYVSSDDGERLWINNVASTTPTLDKWNQRGVTTDTSAGIALTAGKVPIRLEYEQGNGGAVMRFEWSSSTIPRSIVPGYYLSPPDGPAAPTTVTATGSTTTATASVDVSWNASATTPITGINYILSRATAPGGPYTQVAVQAGLTFTDTTANFGSSYYYVVQATDLSDMVIGPASTPAGPATPVLPPVTVTPLGPITTSESGTTATLTLTVNQVPAAAASITITSSNPNQAIVSGQGNGDASVQGPAGTIQININSGTAVNSTFTITVQGVEDFYDNGNQPYTISFVVSGGGAPWTGASIPTVNGTNMDIDVAGLLVNPTGGLFTDTNGGQAQFAVRLNTKPLSGGVVTVNLTSSNPTEGTVSPTQIQFVEANYDQPVTVTVTGQGTNLLYLNQAYTVTVAVTSTTEAPTASYNTSMVVNVSLLNLHLEIPPALPHVWGGSKGSGGGCGLTGLEAVILLGLGAAWRRRRRA
jgi:hypothetical protein